MHSVAVGAIANGFVAGFGSSDCDCPGHLFFFAAAPLKNPAFVDLLLRFRIDRLEKDLPPAPAQKNERINRVSVPM